VPRKEPTQERAAFTVDAIVTAVEQVLEQGGVAALNTNRVAELAGVSIGTLYQYFPNKESLVGAVQARYLDHTFGLCRAALAAAAGVPLADVIARVTTALVAAYHAQRPIHRWLIELRTAAGFQGRFRAAIDAFVDEVAALLDARHDVRFPDARAAAYAIVHAVNGLVSATGERNREVDIDAIAAATSAMITAYVSAFSATRS